MSREMVGSDAMNNLSLAGKLCRDWDSESLISWHVAELMAEASRIAYQSNLDIQREMRLHGFGTIQHFEDQSMSGFVASVEETAVIVFRGTNDLEDWIVNLDAREFLTSHGMVHSGFYGSYQGLRSQVSSIVRRLSSSRVWITGHSLGGALALLCAYDQLVSASVPVHGVMTFGQPMLTGKRLAEFLGRKLAGRFSYFINELDPVPRMPPGYLHCGSMIWFRDGGVERSQPRQSLFGSPDGSDRVESEGPAVMDEREFRELQRDLRESRAPDLHVEGTPLMRGNLPLIRDHGMDEYLAKIQGQLAQGN